ncbi:MAG: hypothetical protein LH649_03930 [Pseudanabaena sp. CAN_BIN31]|nr:hypothetical protein [Pseudanabaena sp. CAN_BIN31]
MRSLAASLVLPKAQGQEWDKIDGMAIANRAAIASIVFLNHQKNYARTLSEPWRYHNIRLSNTFKVIDLTFQV